MSRGRFQSNLRAACLSGGLALLWLVLGCDGFGGLGGEGDPAERALEGETRLSILALGDTGKQPIFGFTPPGQLAVAQALSAEHRRDPADLLVFLGDNFYDVGLRNEELLPRLRANLVRPYCAFLSLDGACSAEVADACTVPAAARHSVPILAVLGNHDYQSPESPGLQRERVPCFVPNWHVPEELVARMDLAPGVSLIAYDSYRLHQERAYDQLSAAIRAAPGPWRIVVGHAPLRDNIPGIAVRNAIANAKTTVHAHLAGHAHNLQIARPFGEAGPLQVVAGAGSEARAIKVPLLGAEFAAVELGFARLDLVEGAEGLRLVVSLLGAPALPFESVSEPRLIARWSVDRESRITRQR